MRSPRQLLRIAVDRWEMSSRPWLLAALTGAAGVGLRLLAEPLLGSQLPFVVAFPVTALAASLWGTGPGLLTATFCMAPVVVSLLLTGNFPVERPIQIGAFGVSAVVTCLVCGRFSRRSSEPAGVVPPSVETSLTSWLRTVLWGAVLIPTSIFAAACWWGYEHARRQAEQAVSHASALALRQAERSFVNAAEVARRVVDVVDGDDAEIRSREASVRQRLRDIAVGLPWVVNINVWDASGKALASSDGFPLDGQVLVADRAYFIERQRGGPDDIGISELLTGRLTGKTVINATLRRSRPDGSFGGVISVAFSPAFFADYYRSLANEQPDLASFALIRTDGALLARWPRPFAVGTVLPPDQMVLARIRAGESAGVLAMPQTRNYEPRLLSFRRVAGYPVYVTAGMSRSAVLAGWLQFVALLASVMVPTTLGLVCVSWVALKKTRREQAVLVELREEIARRAKAEQAMLQSQKLEALAQLTGGVAHDFNNLLTIVNTSLHVHRRRHPELKDERQLESMSRAIRSGVRLTRQLLSFSRRQALRPETVQLQQWLPTMDDLIRSTLGRSVSLEISAAPDTHPITVDLAELELALINTALNAEHAMPGGGRLRLSAQNAAHPQSASTPMVALRIEDSGAGIPPELVQKVFEPFFTTKGPGKGSGLGLSQVYGLCMQAGGLAVIERSSASGTVIGMYFPPATESGASADAALPAEAPRTLNGRVLLVEDNEDVATATESLLRSAGLDVTRAANADLALGVLADSPAGFDLVLSDVSMPGSIDGVQLAFLLRERRPKLPVLLTTGYAERVHDALAAGFQVLSKPAAPEDILGEIARVLAAARPATMPA